MTTRVVGDLSKLHTVGFRSHGLWFWATIGFIGIEGAGFALACATYVYLMTGAVQWPLRGEAPDLFWGTAQTVLLLASLIPNFMLSRAARRRDAKRAQALAVFLAILNLLSLVLRAFEFPHLNCRW